MLKVKTRALLLIAGLVWLAAGANILRIGFVSMISVWLPENFLRNAATVLLAVVILTGFLFMFRRIVTRHTTRILGYKEEKKSVFLFFDLKGYLMMAFMMGLGIVLRRGDFLPDFFFAFFYTGLGIALSVSGIRFLVRYFGLTLRQMIWILIGVISFSLGTAGIFLPILPTVPLYLLASVSLLNSSETLYIRFKNSRLYKNYLQPYLDAGGLSSKQKIVLILFVAFQIAVAAILLRNSIVGLVILGVVFAGFLISMLFYVKTVPPIKKERNEKGRV